MKYKYYRYNFKHDRQLALIHVIRDLSLTNIHILMRKLEYKMVSNANPKEIVELLHSFNIKGFQATAVVWQAKRNLNLRLEKY